MALFDSTAWRVGQETGKEMGSDTQQRDPGRESNPGPLQSLGTWVARATDWAMRRPYLPTFLTNTVQYEEGILMIDNLNIYIGFGDSVLISTSTERWDTKLSFL